ncbi:hypothetical protein CABS02_13177 [Colletotrichum abscissum]|uniref:Uncharacterized protein n=1 Tax=Colletotrichum abscissum TaxID=1671311 RepID=A0A9P9X3D5_9PEZI|nr:hypothetical protein CABS02_13177 [Colletotrichum abscissum]
MLYMSLYASWRGRLEARDAIDTRSLAATSQRRTREPWISEVQDHRDGMIPHWLARDSVEGREHHTAIDHTQIPANDDYPPLETDRGLLLCAGSFGCYQETPREGGKRLDWCLLQFKHSDRFSTIVVILDDCAADQGPCRDCKVLKDPGGPSSTDSFPPSSPQANEDSAKGACAPASTRQYGNGAEPYYPQVPDPCAARNVVGDVSSVSRTRGLRKKRVAREYEGE